MYRKYFYQKSVKITVAVLCSNLILQNVAFAKSSQKIDSTLSLQQVINTKVAETPLQNRLEIITAWVEQGEDTALKQWGTHHPNEIIAIQKILLSDLLFAEVNNLPPSHFRSKEILLALQKQFANPELESYIHYVLTEQLSWLIDNHFLRYWYANLSLDEQSNFSFFDEDINTMLNLAFQKKYATDTLPDIRHISQKIPIHLYDQISYVGHDTVYDDYPFEARVVLSRAGIIKKDVPVPEFRPLSMQLYSMSVRLEYQQAEFIELVKQASKGNYSTLRIWGLLQLSQQKTLMDTEKLELLNRALSEAEQGRFDSLKIRALIQISEMSSALFKKHEQELKNEIENTPENNRLEYKKLYADLLLKFRRINEARDIYRELISSQEPKYILWLLSTLEATKDEMLIPFLNDQFSSEDSFIRAHAIKVWHGLRHDYPQIKVPRALFKDQALPVQLNLLRFVYQENPQQFSALIEFALTSNSISLKEEAVIALCKTPEVYRDKFPYWQFIAPMFRHLDQYNHWVLFQYLRTFAYHEPDFIATILREDDRNLHWGALQVMLERPSVYPIEIITPLVKDKDVNIRKNATYLLLLKGQKLDLNQYLELLTNYSYSREVLVLLKKEVDSGRMNWNAVMTAILNSKATDQGVLLEGIISTLGSDLVTYRAFLESHFSHFSESAQVHILNTIRDEPSPQMVDIAYDLAHETMHPELKLAALRLLSQVKDENSASKFDPLFLDVFDEDNLQQLEIALDYFIEHKKAMLFYNEVKKRRSQLSESQMIVVIDAFAKDPGHSDYLQDLLHFSLEKYTATANSKNDG